MALISVKQAVLSFGGEPLLDGVELHIEAGERVCLLGANGTGKSTLLQVLGGALELDAGEVVRRAGLTTAMMPQQVVDALTGPVTMIVYPHYGHDDNGKLTLEADQMLSRLGIDAHARFEELSGGARRRVLLARALLGTPDVLLLDEPTNHLDIDSILWLENFLTRLCKTIVFVTHDRAFLRQMATRIVELDRGKIVDWACDYDTFLIRRGEVAQTEEKIWERFDKKLAQEEAWLRRGVKARTTRNQGRVRALEALREERAQRRQRSGTAQLSIQEASRTGRLVARATDVAFAYGAQPLIRRCSVDILRGDKVGVIGPNGCGKTTLLRLLLGADLTPQQGTIKAGANVETVYSDQLRTALPHDATVVDAIANEREFVVIDGQRRHVLSYLEDFLFAPERARQPIQSLSGGERNRLLLASLFALPSNVLVLDEPTNDLDLDTLDVLEEQIAAYNGTVLIVSHDRAFLNAVTNRTLAFEKYDQRAATGDWLNAHEGWFVNEYAGNCDDWLAQRRLPPAATPKKVPPPQTPTSRQRRLSYAERQELLQLPPHLETLEAERTALHAQLADPVFYKSAAPATINEARERCTSLDQEIEAGYARWEQLEQLAGETQR